MKLLRLLTANIFRNKLRTLLTMTGLAIAITAFGIMRVVVAAWHSQVDASVDDRLVVRHAVSFFFALPLAYREKIANIPGVEKVSPKNWFDSVYVDESRFFARWAIDAETIFDIYPDFRLTDRELADFKRERNACVIGEDLSERYHLKIGDHMTLEGDATYPGKWEFVVRGIYRPGFETTDTSQMFFHWKYLHERSLRDNPDSADDVHMYVIKISNAVDAAEISNRIDAFFANSAAETKTETEGAFQQGFLSAYAAMLNAIDAMSFVVLGIILLILANTMAMSAGERTREYAILKALGFKRGDLVKLITGESLFIAGLGGAAGILLTFPIVNFFASIIPKGILSVFRMDPVLIGFTMTAILLIGIGSSLFPLLRVFGMNIVDGFRFSG